MVTKCYHILYFHIFLARRCESNRIYRLYVNTWTIRPYRLLNDSAYKQCLTFVLYLEAFKNLEVFYAFCQFNHFKIWYGTSFEEYKKYIFFFFQNDPSDHTFSGTCQIFFLFQKERDSILISCLFTQPIFQYVSEVVLIKEQKLSRVSNKINR